jgi:hypothetical protein
MHRNVVLSSTHSLQVSNTVSLELEVKVLRKALGILNLATRYEWSASRPGRFIHVRAFLVSIEGVEYR